MNQKKAERALSNLDKAISKQNFQEYRRPLHNDMEW